MCTTLSFSSSFVCKSIENFRLNSNEKLVINDLLNLNFKGSLDEEMSLEHDSRIQILYCSKGPINRKSKNILIVKEREYK